MNRNSLIIIALASLSMLSCRIQDPVEKMLTSKSVISFVVGGDAGKTKSGATSSIEPVDLSKDCEVDGLILSESVTSIDEAYFPECEVETKGTPVYTENFDGICGGFSAAAFEPKSDGSKFTDIWGADTYLANGGVVPFQKAEDSANTYYYDYNTGFTDAKVNWPESGKLLYFLQTPYSKTSTLGVEYYAPDDDHPMGSIQFDYTSPTSGEAGTDAEVQTDILFTSKLINIDKKDTDNEVVFYHSLTAIKFKDGTTGNNGSSSDLVHIQKVTFNNIVGSGHCTISPSYGKGNTLKPSSE